MAKEQSHHITPSAVLLKTMLALLVLTVLTVGAAQMDLGMLKAPVAFLIAIIKALLVMSFFMGLKYDERNNRIIFSLGFFFLAVFIFFCALDIYSRVPIHSTL